MVITNRYRQKQTRARRRGEQSRADQIRARKAKKTPDRSGPNQTEELAELRGDSRQTVKTDTEESDRGRQLK
jgi:hypothetical protein